jgi:hypothetical protein
MVRSAAVFAAVLGAGLVVWPAVRPQFSASFARIGHAALAGHTFGERGHVELAPISGPGARNGWDCQARLRVEGDGVPLVIALHPRRMAYLPLLVFAAAVASAPLRARRRAVCLLCGLPLVLGAVLASLWLTFAWIFARVPGLVYSLTPLQEAALHAAHEGLLSHLGVRLLLPLLLAVGLASWQLTLESRAAARRSTPAGGQRAPRTRGARRPAPGVGAPEARVPAQGTPPGPPP